MIGFHYSGRVGGAEQRGQTAVFALPLIVVVLLSLLLLFDSGQLLRSKSGTQQAADATAYSVAVLSARERNFVSYINRAMVSNEVAIGQLLALESWSRRYQQAKDEVDESRKLQPLRPVRKVLQAILTPQQVLGSRASGPISKIAKPGQNILSRFNSSMKLFQNAFNLATIQGQLEVAGQWPGQTDANIVAANFPSARLSNAGELLLPLSIAYQQIVLQPRADDTAQSYMAGMINRSGGKFLNARRSGDSGLGFWVNLERKFDLSDIIGIDLGTPSASLSAGMGFQSRMGFNGGSEFRQYGDADVDEDRYQYEHEAEPGDAQSTAVIDWIRNRGPKNQYAWSTLDNSSVSADFEFNISFAADLIFTKIKESLEIGPITASNAYGGYAIQQQLAGRTALGRDDWGHGDEDKDRAYGGLWRDVDEVDTQAAVASSNEAPWRNNSVGSRPDRIGRGLSGFMNFHSDLWSGADQLPFIVALATPYALHRGADEVLGLQPSPDNQFALSGDAQYPEEDYEIEAVGVAEAHYRNPDVRDERPNAFSPYWEPRLIEPDEQTLLSIRVAQELTDALDHLPSASQVANGAVDTVGGLGPVTLDSIDDLSNIVDEELVLDIARETFIETMTAGILSKLNAVPAVLDVLELVGIDVEGLTRKIVGGLVGLVF